MRIFGVVGEKHKDIGGGESVVTFLGGDSHYKACMLRARTCTRFVGPATGHVNDCQELHEHGRGGGVRQRGPRCL